MKIPAKRKKIPQKRSPGSWVPPGQEVTVGPYWITDGMVYVGQRLAALSRWGGELAGRDGWDRRDFEDRAAALGLLPDGALEMLNEAAFHLCGAPLLEGDEALEIDPGVLRQMLGWEGAEP
jgi:hypothetical protein